MNSPIASTDRTPFSIVGRHLRAKMLAGILALIPLVVTFLVLRLVFNFLDGLVQPLVEKIWHREIPGVGLVITLVTIYVTGLVAANVLGRFMIRQAETVILHIPLVKWIYNIAKNMVDALTAAGKGVSRVVIVEWPKKGTYTVGFLTSSTKDSDGKVFHCVLVPTTPTPQSGMLAILPEEDVIFTNMSVEEGVKLIVSSGILTPPDLMKGVGATPGKARETSTPAPGGSHQGG